MAASSGSESLVITEENCLLGNYARWPVDFVKGDGSILTDSDGKKYLDFGTGIAVNAFGHAFPPVLRAITEQAKHFTHLSNLFPVRSQTVLGERLLRATGLDRAFFCNSGTEANEAAAKFARLYFSRKNAERTTILSFENSFHGRTYASLAMTGQPKLREGFGPMPAGFVNLPWNDSTVLKKAADKTVAAIILEPIIAEGGILEAEADFLSTLREVCEEHGILLIADEVQTGLGRTGTFLACESYALEPDIITLAKPLGGGLPLGAVLFVEEVAMAVKPGDHGSTFGGNPVACAAGLAVVDALLGEGFLEDVKKRSTLLREGLTKLAQEHESLGEIRGRGFLLGVHCTLDLTMFLNKLRDNGLIALRAGSNVLRLLPPLNVSEQEIQEALNILAQTLQKDES